MSNYIVVGGSDLQKDFIEKVKANGFVTHVVDYDESCIGSQIADHFHCLSIDDLEGVLRLAQKLDAVGISTVATEQGNITANYVAEKLNLIGNGFDVSLNTTDKSRMKQVIAAHGLKSPMAEVVLSKEQLSSLEVSFPVIVKASDRSAGRGVALANNREELENFYDESYSVSFNKKVLVEEYVDGPQYSLETISSKGQHQLVAITEMGFSGPPHFVETTHRLPAPVSPKDAERLKGFALDCLNAFDIQYGACHIEVRLVNGAPTLIEIASRMGGWRHWMIESALSVDYLQLILDSSLGKPVVFNAMDSGKVSYSRHIFGANDYQLYLEAKDSKVVMVADLVKENAPTKDATNLIEAHGFYITLEDAETKQCQ
ncbi:ATP-grasp domain-containing protein [Vibrio maritimus]|uniref:ATP-grasp domain-containing protein n=1 Tax=Vibrio maritimus TaxID=990268 RepID=UPI001F2215C7|nr:ATP-grasp domain-containing protein [Vibrio maritimus]